MSKLRVYQQTLKAKIYNAWDDGHNNVLARLPTGGGKTRIFCDIAIEHAISSTNKLPTAIMVHRKELLQQISLTLAEDYVKHNIIAPRSVILSIIAGHRKVFRKQYYDHTSSLSIISVDTLNARILQHEKWAKSIKLWITDEAAHLLRSNKWGRAVEYFPNAKGLGVTATPQRLDKKGLGVHADGVFNSMVEGPETRWLTENGYLCPYKIAVPSSDYQDYLSKANSNADHSRQSMAKASRESKITGDIIENYIKFAEGKQTIVFASDIESAETIEKNFNDRDIPAKLLTGETDNKERLMGLIDFKSKKTRILINVDLFDEGLDVPGIECVIMGRPTMSLSKYLQMIGRGLRVDIDKEFLIVIDHVGNVARHGLPDARRSWTLDRIVKRKNTVSLVRICGNPECNSPYERTLTKCPYCGWPAFAPGGEGGGRPGPKQVDGDLVLIDPKILRQMEADTHLEAPGRIGRRVSKAAGAPAGKKAEKNQIERINTQQDLVKAIAVWAGKQRTLGYSDRRIHKLFFIERDQTISQALAEPRKDMLNTIEELDSQLWGHM